MKLIGSMLTPFCIGWYNSGDWWVQLLGVQVIYDNGKFKLNYISIKQQTTKLRWFLFGKPNRNK